MMGGISRLSRRNVGDDQIERRSVLRRHIEEFKNQRSFLVFPRLYSHKFRHHFDFPDLPNSIETYVNVGQNLLAVVRTSKSICRCCWPTETTWSAMS